MDWIIDNGLTVEDYQDMEMFSKRRRYPICAKCAGRFVRENKEQVDCWTCRAKNQEKILTITLIKVEL